MERAEVPDFFMPFPAVAPNPGRGTAHAPMWDWIDRFGLFTSDESRDRLVQLEIELITARYHPYVDPDLMPLFAQFMAWAWIVDEQFDDGPAGRDPAWCLRSIQGITAAFDGRVGENPLEEAAADLRERLFHGRPERWCRGFVAAIRAWIWTYYVEAIDRATARYQRLAEYRLHRELGSGEYLFFALSEMGAALDLPEHVHRLPALTLLRSSSAQHQGLFNDIVSLAKEVPVGYFHNAVALTVHHDNVTVPEAVEAVNAALTECVERFIAAERDLPVQLAAAGIDDGTAERAMALADAYKAHLRGNFDWHSEVSRYSAPGKTSDGQALYVADLLAGRRADQ